MTQAFRAAIVALTLMAHPSIGRSDEINWLYIGISTGKFSESIFGKTFRTEDDCAQYSGASEDSICLPIPALPQSYWDKRQAEIDLYNSPSEVAKRMAATREWVKRHNDKCLSERKAYADRGWLNPPAEPTCDIYSEDGESVIK